MAKKVGLITINLLAGTAEFNTQMDSAKAKIRSLTQDVDGASKKLVSGNQAASGFIRVAENGMANNLRAVENFMTRTLGLGPLMQAIFPVVGAIAFAGLVVSLGEKVYSFFKKAEEGAQRVNNAFREMIGPMRLTNDELRVSNDRLENEIAKLEGKRQNNVQIMLDDARVAADRLGDSLASNLRQLNEMLQKEKIHWFNTIFTNEDTTTGLADQMKKFAEDEGEIVDKAQEKIRAAADRKDQKSVDDLSKQMATDVDKHRKDTITDLEKQLKIERDIRDTREGIAQRTGMEGAYNSESNAGLINQLRAALEVAKVGVENVDLTQKHTTLQKQLTGAQATDANARLERPLTNKLADLDVQIAQQAARLNEAGKTEAQKEHLKAIADGTKEIEEVDKALAALHEPKLDTAGEQKIRDREAMFEGLKGAADEKTKLAATLSEMKARTDGYRELSAAIDLSYEATKKANAEMEVRKFAGEKYGDAEWMKANAGDVDKVRAGANAESDAKNKPAVEETTKKLEEQIALEQKLVVVQSQGEDAVRRLTLAMQIQDLVRTKGVEAAAKLGPLMQKLNDEERAALASKNLGNINVEIDAIQRMTAARALGAEAVRKLTLELKYEADIRKEGADVANIPALRREDELKHQEAITEEVLKTANADRDRLADIAKEVTQAKLLIGSAADQLGIMIKLRDLENERLTIMARQQLALGTIQGGFRAFFTEMNKEVEKPGKILFDGLNSALNSLSENLTKVLTRQKTAWGQMFKSIGDEMLKSSIKAGLQHGLAAAGNTALGKKLGLGGLGGKPDFTRLNPGHVVIDGGAPGGSPAKALGGLGVGARDGQTPATAFYMVSASGGPAGAGVSGLAGLGGLAGLFGGAGAGAGSGVQTAVDSSITFLAGGGDMSADQSYVVGDEGPEILRKTRGTIMSNADSRRMLGQQGGGDHYYNIDARGTDPALTEQRVRAAIIASHNSAVGTAVAATADNVKRNPKR